MTEIEISLNRSTQDPENDFRHLLGNLEEETGMRVHCNLLKWEEAWSEIMKIVLYKHGPVISQVGTTWMGSLEATDGVRNVTSEEMNSVAPISSIHAASWQTCLSANQQMIGIPWYLDAYMLYYRRDLFEKAHIDESTAFTSLEALDETAAKLRAAGHKIPLLLAQAHTRANIHNIASWIWTHGGDFTTPDGKTLLWSEEKTRQGIRAYFSLGRHITPPQPNCLTDDDCYSLFQRGNAVMTLRNAGLLHVIQNQSSYDALRDRIALAPMPGVNFVGGSNLVLWKHLPPQLERFTFKLLKRLLSPETQYEFNIRCGILPARIEALEKVQQETLYKPVINAITQGRSLQKFRLWGLLEDKLINAIGRIWQILHEQENPDIDQVLSDELDPLERRLQLTISNN